MLEAQVRRMLKSDKSRAFVENFTGQWLEIRRLESVKPDRERFPDFDDYLRLCMRRETELFFGHVMREDRPILEFLNADYTFLNERLARHYQIPGIRGPEFRRVTFTGTHRRGILTQASVLTVSSYGNRTSPVLRGKWILEDLLNTPPPPLSRMSRTWMRRSALRPPAPATRRAPQRCGLRIVPLEDGPSGIRTREFRCSRPVAPWWKNFYCARLA
ncbi:MAG: DUF1592 domain-containing protein [Bryobacteraceae bacterium]